MKVSRPVGRCANCGGVILSKQTVYIYDGHILCSDKCFIEYYNPETARAFEAFKDYPDGGYKEDN